MKGNSFSNGVSSPQAAASGPQSVTITGVTLQPTAEVYRDLTGAATTI